MVRRGLRLATVPQANALAAQPRLLLRALRQKAPVQQLAAVPRARPAAAAGGPAARLRPGRATSPAAGRGRRGRGRGAAADVLGHGRGLRVEPLGEPGGVPQDLHLHRLPRREPLLRPMRGGALPAAPHAAVVPALRLVRHRGGADARLGPRGQPPLPHGPRAALLRGLHGHGAAAQGPLPGGPRAAAELAQEPGGAALQLPARPGGSLPSTTFYNLPRRATRVHTVRGRGHRPGYDEPLRRPGPAAAHAGHPAALRRARPRVHLLDRPRNADPLWRRLAHARGGSRAGGHRLRVAAA
mmetsp:Transcript_23734/g.74708  ORF Transcript_23734/g.74708 Transcript_23734/m.74708 type:complete len:298 (+) Transcript_23734:178-1071(+)